MPYVESFDGNKIYYEIKGKGRSVIFLPCVGATTAYWKYQEPLSKKYQMVLIDTAGIGKSDKNRKDYNYPSLAKDVIAVIKKEKLSNVILVGHSFGGVIALEVEIRIPDEISGIIVFDSLLQNTIWYGKKASEEEIKEQLKDYEGNYQEYYDNLLRNMVGDRIDEERKQWLVDIAGYNANESKILRNMVLQMLLSDFNDIFRKVNSPIYYMIRDLYNNVEEITKYQKNAVVLKGVGHLANIEQPEQFNKELVKLIESIP